MLGATKKNTMYFELIELTYHSAQLVVRVANLVEGAPDGYIGTPLVIGSESKRYTVTFDGVADFRSTAEPCFSIEGSRKDITEFLFECIGSQYVEKICPFGVGATSAARHFCVFTESVVIEVLAENEPQIQ
jgi:hypothetical protein